MLQNHKIMTKHLGKVKSNGERVALLYKHLPESFPPKALVLYIDKISDIDKDEVHKILHSSYSQNKEHLADSLHDHKMLKTLHEKYQQKSLIAVDIDDILLTPSSDSEFELRKVLDDINRSKSLPLLPSKDSLPQDMNQQNVPDMFNTLGESTPEQKAQSLLRQAELLENDVKRMRQEAHDLSPSTTLEEDESTNE